MQNEDKFLKIFFLIVHHKLTHTLLKIFSAFMGMYCIWFGAKIAITGKGEYFKNVFVEPWASVFVIALGAFMLFPIKFIKKP